MDSLHLEEYRSLRAVVSQRGSLRIVLFAATLAAWGLTVVLVSSLLVQPLAAIVPLLVLMAGFEAVHALHVGAERIGRYLYVRYESVDGPAWETAIAKFGNGQFGAAGRPAGAHFALIFSLAAATNLVVLGLAALPQELAALALLHLVALARIAAAVRAASGQRARDEARFRAVLK